MTTRKGLTFEALPQAIELLLDEMAEIKAELKRIKGAEKTVTYINVEEAAAFIGKAVSTIRTLSQKGKIPSYKIGKHRKYIKEELAQWMTRFPGHMPNISEIDTSPYRPKSATERLLRSKKGRRTTPLI